MQERILTFADEIKLMRTVTLIKLNRGMREELTTLSEYLESDFIEADEAEYIRCHIDELVKEKKEIVDEIVRRIQFKERG